MSGPQRSQLAVMAKDKEVAAAYKVCG
jgi:hypothetical protein